VHEVALHVQPELIASILPDAVGNRAEATGQALLVDTTFTAVGWGPPDHIQLRGALNNGSQEFIGRIGLVLQIMGPLVRRVVMAALNEVPIDDDPILGAVD
jgi:hypothetical protein